MTTEGPSAIVKHPVSLHRSRHARKLAYTGSVDRRAKHNGPARWASFFDLQLPARAIHGTHGADAFVASLAKRLLDYADLSSYDVAVELAPEEDTNPAMAVWLAGLDGTTCRFRTALQRLDDPYSWSRRSRTRSREHTAPSMSSMERRNPPKI